ncbi:MAG: Gfo/Idh/MocA family oxidoreductase [Eubacteriales bacterium]|nr:Gfo/Idh/MocA family oxidoreductase [Eubacteriales bacterium]
MKIGIIGAGGIAGTMAATVSRMDDVTRCAVASRDLTKARAFAEAYGFEKAYGSYEELVSDPEVDFVYIATPHSHHFEHAALCIRHSKHVLCEKAFTMNAAQAEELFRLAGEHGVLITEAIWTRYMPSRRIINELLEEGVIGEVRTLTANLSYRICQNERIVRPELAGGALLDVGVYPLNFALMHFGNGYQSISSSAVMTDTGVDGQNCLTLAWPDGRFAVLNSGIYGESDRRGTFYGSEGYMVVENINNPEEILIYDNSHRQIRRVEVPEQISGYEYEVRELMNCIRRGEKECPSMPHAETLRVMRIMDGLRSEWGIVYPQER